MPIVDESPHSTDGCGIAAIGTIRVPIAELPAIEKAPGPPGGAIKVKPALLKHADDQTTLGLAATLRAVARAGLAPSDLDQWGVIAAPRFLGRIPCAVAMARYRRQGPLSISPLIIPSLSLHSMSGTISLALKAHGANFGVGGGTGNLSEALLAGIATLREQNLPGLWVVATCWAPDLAPDDEGANTVPSACGYALALGLVADGAAGSLRVVPTNVARDRETFPDVSDLVRFLESDAPAAAWYQPVPGLGAIELTPGTLLAAEQTSMAG